MADDADSKSVAGNRVWVQVPLPALKLLSNQEFFVFTMMLASWGPPGSGIIEMP